MNNSTADRGATFKSDSSDEPMPVAWITGSGAKRVGRAIAREFANSSYRVVVHANRSIDEAAEFAKELRDLGTEVLVVQGEISQSDTPRRIVDEILHKFGRLDVLVNSAAIWDWKDFDQLTADDVRQQFEVNSLGTFLCSQAAGMAMVRQRSGGAILLIGDWAVQRPYPKFAAYFASKGTIETLTRTLAVELGTRNSAIRVNAVLPGPVLLDESVPAEKAERIRLQSLLKRHGTPEDVARAARFLSEQPFITGVCLPVDGGRSVFAGEQLDAVAHPTFDGE